MKSPFDAIIDIFKVVIERSATNQKSNFDNLNKYIIWVVSFSAGGTALIVSNINSFNLMFPHLLIKILLYLFFLSIFSGIVFRYAFFMYNTQLQMVDFYLIGAFSNTDVMTTDYETVEHDNNIDSLINSLKLDFGMDYSHMSKDYAVAPENIKTDIIKFLKEKHRLASDYSKKSLELGLKHVKETFAAAYGISEEKIDKMMFNRSTKKLHFFQKFTNFSFWVCCGSFLLVIILLSIYY
jgi:hypothetical protein